MAIPTINDIAGITADPELKFTPQGTAILNVRLAFNDSKYNEQTSKWETTKTFYVDGQIWEQAAERNAEILAKGDQVFVEGRLETQSWEKDGEKKSKPSLNIKRIRKLEKGQPSQGVQGKPPHSTGRNPNPYGQPAQRPQGEQPFGKVTQGWASPAEDPWGQPQTDQPAF